MKEIGYSLIRSERKSVAVQIKDGKIIVRAPMFMAQKDIDSFLEKHREWIESHMAKSLEAKERIEDLEPLTREMIEKLAEQALIVIPTIVERYAKEIGVKYGRITVRNQRSRWGSCSSSGNLSFNCLLMLAPREVLESVIVHELCHIKEMNHSKRFYAEVLRVFPDYHKHNAWLKENGGILIRRMLKK